MRYLVSGIQKYIFSLKVSSSRVKATEKAKWHCQLLIDYYILLSNYCYSCVLLLVKYKVMSKADNTWMMMDDCYGNSTINYILFCILFKLIVTIKSCSTHCLSYHLLVSIFHEFLSLCTRITVHSDRHGIK